LREIIHIELIGTYPPYRLKEINKMLSKHFKNVDKDTFELKEGVFLKINDKELLIYEK